MLLRHNVRCMQIEVVTTLRDIPAPAWDALSSGAPGALFVSHAYLNAMHETGCAVAKTGWQPQYLLARDDNGELIGALPLYLKAHSYGEYVFDWAWANAFEQAGGDYYPKLLCAVPFTPCTGPRALARTVEVQSALIAAARTLASKMGVSSLHALFPDDEEILLWKENDLSIRQGVQFHWINHGFETFDAMLAAMTHDKRKRIKQDRRYVTEAGVTWRTSRGHDISEEDLAFFYRCYEGTYAAHMSTPYLSLKFFQHIVRDCNDAIVLFIGEREGAKLCSSLCIVDGDTMYGRYWGTMQPLKSLHFEACYYQPLAWCIANKLQRFEGGAQGAHKLARGLLPTATYSAHWIANKNFAKAVDNFLKRETAGVKHTLDELSESSPFKVSTAS
jgi:uncharacterized protein